MLGVLLFTCIEMNGRHMFTFREALNADDYGALTEQSDATAPSSPLVGPSSQFGSHRVRKVSALSDFAPVNQRVRRYVLVGISARVG